LIQITQDFHNQQFYPILLCLAILPQDPAFSFVALSSLLQAKLNIPSPLIILAFFIFNLLIKYYRFAALVKLKMALA